MVHCENCQYYREGFEYDDYSGDIWDYCKCGLTDDLLDTTERNCADFEPCE